MRHRRSGFSTKRQMATKLHSGLLALGPSQPAAYRHIVTLTENNMVFL